MITYAGNYATIAAATIKDNVTWLFQMDKNGNGTIDYYWSNKDYTWSVGPQAHTGVVIDFDGIQMNRAQSESGIQAPSEFSFTISNEDNTLTTADFSSARLTLRLMVKAKALEEEMRIWIFRVMEVEPGYQTLTFHCVDWLQAYLEGDYPNTPRIQDIFPRANVVATNACVPLILGKPCIPLESVPLERITNGDMEIDGNWAEYDGCATCEQSNEQAHSGTYSWKVVTTATPGAIGEGIQGDTFTTITGKCYTLTFWVYSSGAHATEPHVVIRARKGNDSGFNNWPDWAANGTTVFKGFLINTWTKCTVTWKETAGGAGAYIVLCNIGDTYTSYYDDVSVEERYYVLGPAAPVYAIDTVRTPSSIDGGKSTWKSTERTFTQSVMTGRDANNYDVVEYIITDGDGDGTPDANLVYEQNGKYLGLPTYYSRNDTAGLTAPGDALEYILEDWGIPSAMIDDTSKDAANVVYASWGLTWNMGFWFQESRKKILARLLGMCHTELIVRDKVYFKVHSKTSQGAEFTKADILKEKDRGEGSFQYEYITTEAQKDSGYVAFQEAGKCLDNIPKFLIGAKGTTDSISDEIIRCDYVIDSQDAQCLGILALQRLLLPMAKARFTTKGTRLALESDDVITINHADYGGNYDVLIDSMTINKDLSIDIEATRHSAALDDWADLDPGAIVIVDDGTSYSYYVLISGPDMTDGGGNQIGNVLPGRLRVGQTGNYILLDPFRPIMKFVEGGQSRLEVGDLAENDYGIEILDHNGNSIMKLDGSGVNTLSGWTLSTTTLANGTNIILDASNKAISINDATFGNAGIQLQYNAGTPRTYIGDGANEYFQFDGTNISWKGANSELTAAGNIICTGGTIGGWTLGATTLTSAVTGSTKIELNAAAPASQGSRISIYDAVSAKLIMGYLDEVVRNNASGTATGAQTATTLKDTSKDWKTNELAGLVLYIHLENGLADEDQVVVSNTSDTITVGAPWDNNPVDGTSEYEVRYSESDYGFWAKSGDYLQIDGDIDYVNGDWLLQHDASLKMYDGSANEIIRLGTYDAEKGLFLFNVGGDLLAKYQGTGITINTGGDIILTGADADPAKVIFSGTSWNVEAYMGTGVGTQFYMLPTDDLATDFNMGTATKRWVDFIVYCDHVDLWSYHDADNFSRIYSTSSTVESNVTLRVKRVGDETGLIFEDTATNLRFRPGSNNAIDNGAADFRWRYGYLAKLDVKDSVDSGFVGVLENTHGTDGHGLLIKAGDSINEYILLLQDKDGNSVFNFLADGTGAFKTAWAIMSPEIEKEDPTPDDYLDWALEDTLKPKKPYKDLFGENVRSIAAKHGVYSPGDEIKKYGKDLAKIAIGTVKWAQGYRNRIKNLEQKVAQLEEK